MQQAGQLSRPVSFNDVNNMSASKKRKKRLLADQISLVESQVFIYQSQVFIHLFIQSFRAGVLA